MGTIQHTRKKFKQGFTLNEILITVIIIGLVSSFAIPQLLIVAERSRAVEGENILFILLGAQIRYKDFGAGNGSYTADIGDLDVEIPDPIHFASPTVEIALGSVARIIRNGSYTLTINEDGVISCTGGPSGLCTKLGYPKSP